MSLVDYGEVVNATLSFAACDKQRCIDILIEDDEEVENVESFSVILERASGLDSRISLSPDHGRLDILDNDGMDQGFLTENVDTIRQV